MKLDLDQLTALYNWHVNNIHQLTAAGSLRVGNFVVRIRQELDALEILEAETTDEMRRVAEKGEAGPGT